MSPMKLSWMSLLISQAILVFLCFVAPAYAAANLTISVHVPENVPIVSCANAENIFKDLYVFGCFPYWTKIADLPRVCPNDPAIDCANLLLSSVWRRIVSKLVGASTWDTAYDVREPYFNSNFCFDDPAWLPVGGWATPRWTKIESDTGSWISVEYQVVSSDYCSAPPCTP